MKNTKLILIQEVPNLGVSGDVVTVAAGYARNYLLPRKYAQVWTKGAQKQIDDLVRVRRRREIASIEDARAIRDSLKAFGVVKVAKRAGESGRLFGAVSAADIVAAIANQAKQNVAANKVRLTSPIKAVGEYEVVVNIHPDIDEITIPLNVVAE